MKQLEWLIQQGSITIEKSGDKISLLFSPDEETIHENLTSTVQIRRGTLKEAVTCLQSYLEKEVHWQDYPSTFFDPDFVDTDIILKPI